MTDAAKAVPPYYERGLNSSVNCFNGYHADCIMHGCSCACHSSRLTAVEDPAKPTEPQLNHDQICQLSRMFNQVAYKNLRRDDEYAINDWLKFQIGRRV